MTNSKLEIARVRQAKRSTPMSSGTYGTVHSFDDNRVVKYQDTGFCISSIREYATVRVLQQSSTKLVPDVDFIECNNTLNAMRMEKYNGTLHGIQVDTENDLRNFLFPVLNALLFLHNRNICHKDIKGRNILLKQNSTKDFHISTIDFGLSRMIPEHVEKNLFPTFEKNKVKLPLQTSSVCTISHRAPELLVGCKEYGLGIDMWSAGVVALELVSRNRVFMNSDDESTTLSNDNNNESTLDNIMSLLSCPNAGEWEHFDRYCQDNEKQILRQNDGVCLFDKIPITVQLSDSAKHLILGMLQINPNERITVYDAIQHPFFANYLVSCESVQLSHVQRMELMDSVPSRVNLSTLSNNVMRRRRQMCIDIYSHFLSIHSEPSILFCALGIMDMLFSQNYMLETISTDNMLTGVGCIAIACSLHDAHGISISDCCVLSGDSCRKHSVSRINDIVSFLDYDLWFTTYYDFGLHYLKKTCTQIITPNIDTLLVTLLVFVIACFPTIYADFTTRQVGEHVANLTCQVISENFNNNNNCLQEYTQLKGVPTSDQSTLVKRVNKAASVFNMQMHVLNGSFEFRRRRRRSQRLEELKQKE